MITLLVLAVALWAAERWCSANWLMAVVTGLPHQPLLLVPVVGLVLARGQGTPTVVAACMLALFTLFVLCSFNVPLRRASSSEGGLTVLSFNIQSGSLGTAAVSEHIVRSGAELVFLQECPEEMAAAVCPAGWHRVAGGDLAIMSPHELTEPRVVNLAEGIGYRPMLSASMAWGGRTLRVYDLHFTLLFFGLSIFSRPAQMPTEMSRSLASRRVQAATFLQNLADGPCIVAGDLNAPPRDEAVQTVHTRLRDAFDDAGWGLGSTFSATTPVVRIDYILSSEDMRTASCDVLPEVASDHKALRAVVVPR